MIPAHLLPELRELEVTTRRAMQTARLGPYTSRSSGPGFDFDQHLPYRAGDDVRRIDWNVTARLNAPYLRQTHAERELDLVIAVDVSRSMQVGSRPRSKREVMTFVTASLLFSAAGAQINAGFLAFGDRVLRWSPPRHASGRSWQLLEELWDVQGVEAPTALLPAVRHLSAALQRTALVVLVSDFFTADDPFATAELRTLAAAHDVVAVVLDDPTDATLPDGRGYLRVRDVETGGEMTVALTPRNRRVYAEAVARHRRLIVDACFRLGMESVLVRSDEAILQPLMDLFLRRKRG
ncbi:MAG TPA: DUF58 domain-containing protein [Vicinamibacterales bacterium]|nr:DUF58 domain-containing protein [Vicinamibacterales bacterium]